MKTYICLLGCFILTSCNVVNIDDGYLSNKSKKISLRNLKNCKKCYTEVKTLNLSNYNLNKFPPVILKLKNLKVLDLSNNNIKKLPANINVLENLEKLNLRGTLVKQLPDATSKLTNLKYILIIDNSLTDSEIIQMQSTIPKNCKLFYSKEMKIDL